MSAKKKKLPVGMFITGLLLTLIISYYMAAAAFPGCTVFTWYETLLIVLKNPFYNNYFNEYTLKICLFTIPAYILLMMVYVTGHNKNYMPGKEMGTAEWANVSKVNKRLADKSKNIHDPLNVVLLVRKKRWWKKK